MRLHSRLFLLTEFPRLPNDEPHGNLRGIVMSSTVTISELQAQTPRIVKETERRGMTAVTRHGRIAAFLISKDRVEAMIETMEILSDKEAMKAIRAFESGKMPMKPVECLDED
jgi:antitoxin YefM